MNEDLRKEGVRLGNRSSVATYQVSQEHAAKHRHLSPEQIDTQVSSPYRGDKEGSNPFDVNLVDMKGKRAHV